MSPSEKFKSEHPILTPQENITFFAMMVYVFNVNERHNLDRAWTGPAEAGIEDYL